MTDVTVQRSGEKGETATLLLAAAEELGLEPHVVRSGYAGYRVPQEVADKAGVEYESPDGEKKAAKKTAKKATRKRAAKKSTAKKSAANSDKE